VIREFAEAVKVVPDGAAISARKRSAERMYNRAVAGRALIAKRRENARSGPGDGDEILRRAAAYFAKDALPK
jgi:hypothetical protein